MARQWHPRALAEIALRGLQPIIAAISAALYGADLANCATANSNGIHGTGFIWLLWLVAVAVFAQKISKGFDNEQEFSVGRVKATVGIDVINILL
ncbi:hypothetical protein FZEAL_6099 [Fusarium zealandicum]|uniref:Uncharacterized protein n=1 Tax=Fusarium zealandicum TaxID=1053134 RepID=A0A8H4XJ57_9HYPO|nr:hypothetical protein FZEAL_6099 [Fusarium zealandicum]